MNFIELQNAIKSYCATNPYGKDGFRWVNSYTDNRFAFVMTNGDWTVDAYAIRYNGDPHEELDEQTLKQMFVYMAQCNLRLMYDNRDEAKQLKGKDRNSFKKFANTVDYSLMWVMQQIEAHCNEMGVEMVPNNAADSAKTEKHDIQLCWREDQMHRAAGHAVSIFA